MGPERLLAEVRDRAASIEAYARTIARRIGGGATARLPRRPAFCVRLVPPAHCGVGGLACSGTVTGYELEELFHGARRYGPGTRLEFIVEDDRDVELIETVAARSRGGDEGTVRVSIQRSAPER